MEKLNKQMDDALNTKVAALNATDDETGDGKVDALDLKHQLDRVEAQLELQDQQNRALLRSQKRLLWAAIAIVVVLCLIMGGLLLRGRTDPFGAFLLRFSNFTEYFWGDALTLVLTLYLLYLIDHGKKAATKSWRISAWSLFAIAAALLIVSQFTGIFYTVSADGIYHRGPLFWLSQVQPYFLYNSLTAIAALCEQAPAEAISALR